MCWSSSGPSMVSLISPSANTRRVRSTIRRTSWSTPSFEAKLTTSGGTSAWAVSGGRVIILSLCLFSNGGCVLSSTDARRPLQYAIVQPLARGGERMPAPHSPWWAVSPLQRQSTVGTGLADRERRLFASPFPKRRQPMRTAWKLMLLAAPLTALALVESGTLAQDGKKTGPDPKEWEQVVDKGIAYLKSKQSTDGSWNGEKSPGITGIALTGMLQTGRVTAKDPAAAKAIKFIEGLINPEAGHIAGKNPRVGLQNYVTCVNVMALVAADRNSYKSVIDNAAKFLKRLQWDEGENKDKDSDFFGGAGYDSKSRPDLSNTQFFLDALVAAGVDKDDEAFKKALVFISRCQNLKGEHNDQPWAGKINDGSFVYSAAGGGSTKVADEPVDGALPGYGSMTYAGVKSMI